MPDRRTWMRFPCELKATFSKIGETDAEAQVAQVSNISASGVGLEVKEAIDVGALLFAGPVGLVVTKGYEFSTLARQTGGSTPIRTAVSHWKVEKGVAYAKDVALATNENRLALHGGLNFVDNEYQEVMVALIDSSGCARVRQKISGPFSKPAADKFAILVPVGPLLTLLDKAKTLIAGGGKCEVFYNGSVVPPK